MTFDITKPLTTRAGKAVTIIPYDGHEPYPILGYVEGDPVIASWTSKGHFYDGLCVKHDEDLINTHAKTYDLELTPEQAVTLQIILELIGGYPGDTLRGFADEIRAKLSVETPFDLPNQVASGAIYFPSHSKTHPAFINSVENAS